MVTAILPATRFEAGVPRPLMKTRIGLASGYEEQYRTLPDGKRFLLKVPVAQEPPPITVLVNWLGAVKR
jgi:hypothetical protein